MRTRLTAPSALGILIGFYKRSLISDRLSILYKIMELRIADDSELCLASTIYVRVIDIATMWPKTVNQKYVDWNFISMASCYEDCFVERNCIVHSLHYKADWYFTAFINILRPGNSTSNVNDSLSPNHPSIWGRFFQNVANVTIYVSHKSTKDSILASGRVAPNIYPLCLNPKLLLSNVHLKRYNAVKSKALEIALLAWLSS